MSWIERCYEIYDRNSHFIGNMDSGKMPLVPVAHTTQQVHIEVRISGNGEFRGARVLGPEEITTIIPCTEESSARTSGAVPHPLVDKLQYLAGDYKLFGGEKESCWKPYIEGLKAWCDSLYGTPEIKAVLSYLTKGVLIADLVNERILFTDEKNQLIKKWEGDKDETPSIFKSVKGKDGPFESFVKFIVDGRDISKDHKLWESFIAYSSTRGKAKGYCYASGKETELATLSPYKIRHAGDRAKLISSNDSTNFTYRGRFLHPKEAVGIGFEVNQKAHSALRWMIAKQGKIISGAAFLVWGTKGEKVPQVLGDSLDILQKWDAGIYDELIEDDEEKTSDTKEVFAKAFNKALAGYRTELTLTAQISVIVLDAAVPGRMGIRYYKELSGSRLMENLENWHHTYKWQMSYRKIKGKNKSGKDDIRITFIGAPSPEDIAKAAYGELVDDKLKQQTVERIMPCIIDGKLLPRDILRVAVNRAVHSIGLERWEANKTQQIACALIRGYYEKRYKEVFSMAVDESIKDRSYVFGRILACAEQVERYAQNLASHGAEEAGSKRPTNAERLMFAYTLHPVNTLTVLQEKLRPYIDRIKANTVSDPQRYAQMLRLISELGVQNYTNDKLGDKFLLGYASQKIQFIEDNKNSKRDESAING